MSEGRHRRHLLVIKGGDTATLQQSLRYAAALVAELQRLPSVAVHEVTVTPSGEWLEHGLLRTPQSILDRIDFALITLVGRSGESGQIQRILQRHGVPYFGSDPMVSGMALMPELAKQRLAASGLTTVPHLVVQKSETTDLHRTAHTLQSLLGNRQVIKPARGGTGAETVYLEVGSGFVRTLKRALDEHEYVMVEQYIPGRDVCCGVVAGLRGQAQYVTPVVELQTTDDYVVHDVLQARKQTPAVLTAALKEQIAQQARLAHQHLELQDISCSFFRVTPEQKVYYIKTSSLPSLEPDAPVAVGLASCGVGARELLEHVIAV